MRAASGKGALDPSRPRQRRRLRLFQSGPFPGWLIFPPCLCWPTTRRRKDRQIARESTRTTEAETQAVLSRRGNSTAWSWDGGERTAPESKPGLPPSFGFRFGMRIPKGNGSLPYGSQPWAQS